MARVVKVGLDVDEAPFVRGMDRAAKAADKLDDALDDVSGSAKATAAATESAKDSTEDLGVSAKGAGRDLDRLRDDAAKLDKQIDETTRSIRDLAREIAATSDEAARADLTRKLTGEQGKLRQQTSLRNLIDVDSADAMGAELAGAVSVSFAAKLGPLLARVPMSGAMMSPAVAAIGAPIAAGIATLLGTAVGGAIIGAVGAGGVVGGLTLAAKDPRVKAAGAELGADLSAMLGRSSAAFVPETLEAIGAIRTRMLGMEDDFARAFGSASQLVDPLVDGLLDAAENAMPGLIDAMAAAPPVIDAVAEGVRDLGEAVGDGLSELAPYADEGARALQTLFFVMEGGVRAAFSLVEGMAALYKVSELIGALLTGDIPKFIALVTAQDDAKSATDGLAGALPNLTGGLQGAGTAASDAAFEIETLDEMVNRLIGEAINAEEANLRLEEAIDRAAEAAKEGAEKGIDPNTAAGRRNREALLGIASAAQDSATAIHKTTGSQELASEATERGRKKFLEAADAMGVEKGEAIALANKLFGIPKEVNTEADFKPDNAGVAAWKRTLSGIDREIFTSARLRAIVNVETRREQATEATGRRWGGITEHARDGLLRDASIYAPVAPARYAFAEPGTGGEAFIPRFGKREQSLDILSKAARWYGQQVVPAGGSGGAGGAGVTNHYYWQPQQANASMADFDAFQRRQDALARVGRPR